MDTFAPNPTKIASKWAIIYVVVTIVITYTFQFLNLDQNSPIKYVIYLPFIAFCFLTEKEFKDRLGGFVTFGKAFSAGFRYALFTGILYSLFLFIYLKVLNPTIMQTLIDTQEAALANKGQSQEAIDKSNRIMTAYGPVLFAVGSAISTTIFGCIVSLVSAAILKREPSVYDMPDEQKIDPTV